MDERFLRSIGFTGFIFGKKDQRDGVKRLCWTAMLDKDESLVIRLKQDQKGWVLDMVKLYGINGKELDNTYFDGTSITEAVKFVQETGTSNFG